MSVEGGRTAGPGGCVVWFTGLSGAGKTTIARGVHQRLQDMGRRVELLDGDAIRQLFPQTGFSPEERDRHVRRVGFLASRLEWHDVIVLVALISPYARSRAFARSLCRRFIEVHVATPLAECERRDVKGLYARARAGQLSDFTGIDAPYEPPDSPELVLDTQGSSIEEEVQRVLALVASVPDGMETVPEESRFV
ncbi:MAG: adenylyl-sulfate kinase [Acidimicrobiia bacterium]|nr:adenylyl-sulfate kinase [Acidimicrobiia bacterium]